MYIISSKEGDSFKFIKVSLNEGVRFMKVVTVYMHITIYFSSCFNGLAWNCLQLGHLHKPRYATLISNAFDFNINYFNRTNCFRFDVRKRSTPHSSRRFRSLLLLFPLSHHSCSVLTNQQRRFRRKRRCVGSCNNL